jgi:aspartyl-tRNA(Asn)/glutamyl-tRNA(Gln) amidotransferase subunit C
LFSHRSILTEISNLALLYAEAILYIIQDMKFDVNHVAKLANLTLSDEEKTKFEKQLEETVEYVKGLDEVDTTEVEPTSQVTGLENITREDEVRPSLSQEEALKNAKSTHNGLFKVKGILANE